jgi:hypothetical protein
MEYQNRGQRCKHGFLIGVVTCPVCQSDIRRGRSGARYERSEGGHVVESGRRKGRPKIGEPSTVSYKSHERS